MIGDGTNLADFTFVQNAAYAHYLAALRLNPESPVCGQAYFITNDDPRPFWGFICRFLAEMGCIGPTKFISFKVAYALAYVMEIVAWILGWMVPIRPTITRHMVTTMAKSFYFSIEKANRELGYSPIINLDHALEITISSFGTDDEAELSPEFYSSPTASAPESEVF